MNMEGRILVVVIDASSDESSRNRSLNCEKIQERLEMRVRGWEGHFEDRTRTLMSSKSLDTSYRGNSQRVRKVKRDPCPSRKT